MSRWLSLSPYVRRFAPASSIMIAMSYCAPQVTACITGVPPFESAFMSAPNSISRLIFSALLAVAPVSTAKSGVS